MKTKLRLERYVALVGLLCLLSTHARSASTRWPTDGCTRQSDTLTCTGTIPLEVPKGIKEVKILDINMALISKIIPKRLFCHISWSAIEGLSISNGNVEPYIYNLIDNMFECLGNLTTLKLTLPYIHNPLPKHMFVGLDKVTTLDMSNCDKLSPTLFFNALNDSKILPNLEKLVLHEINTINDETNIFTNEMFQTLSRGRNITQLDLSNTRLSCRIWTMFTERLCQTLNVLNVADVRIIHEFGPQNILPCYSLETVDISGWIPDLTVKSTKNVSIVKKYGEITYDYYTVPNMEFIKNIKTLYASNIAPISGGKYIHIYNSMINISVLYNLKHLHISQNKLKYINGVAVSQYIRLESLDISNNEMEYLTPRLFQQRMTTSLRMLDISQNMLGHMESNQTEFGTMFTNLIHLEVLRLSHNYLSKMPKDMFAQNKNIQHLDMSNNKLTHVSFDMEHLVNLRYFDISGNIFVNTDSDTINVFNYIYSVQMNNNSLHLKINLHNNRLQCSACSNLEFAKWMTTSPIIDTSHEGYVCETETGQDTPFDRDVVSEIHHICVRPMILRRTVLLGTLIPAAAISMLVITIRYAVKLVRKKRDDAHVAKIRRQIENNEYEFKYPIFLSYSSLDDDLVLNHLYKDLQHHIRVFCRTDLDRELICIGDRHFRAGQWIFDEVSRCLEMSALLVVVMSNNYCHSDWCIAEMQQAYQQHKQMLLIFIENVDEEDMHPILREHFRKRVRVKFCNTDNGDYVIQPEWDSVCSSIIAMLP